MCRILPKIDFNICGTFVEYKAEIKTNKHYIRLKLDFQKCAECYLKIDLI